MILTRGSRGENVKLLQKALLGSGFDPGPVDGIFGPRTEAALSSWQSNQGLNVSGALNSKQAEMLGLNFGESGGGNKGDYTDDPDTRFNGVPGHPEVWQNEDTGEYFLMYEAPGTEPPVPIMWRFPNEKDVKSLFGDSGIKVDRKFNQNQLDSFGALIFGSTNNIPDKDGDMWAGFTDRMERAKKTQPWLSDDEVWAVFAGAWAEGRQPERWELEGTDWWQTHNEAQREWMWIAARDPKQAKEIYESNYIQIFQQMKQLGFTNVPSDIIDYMATEFTHGNWNRSKLEMQSLALAGQETPTGLDKGLRRFMRESNLDVDRPDSGESQIRELWDTWLGPGHPPSGGQLERWAARFRDNPTEARTDLEAKLRKQRMALFPEYEDETLTYDDIASPWRGFMQSAWGELPDETDEAFTKLIRMNDSVEGAKFLRREGLQRGNSMVQRSVVDGLYATVGGPVRAQ